MKKSSEILRISVSGDLDAILDLYRDLTPDDLPFEKEDAGRIYQKILDDDSFMVLVLEHNESIVATCALSIIPNLTRGGMPYAVIENVVTKTDKRKKGFGTKIMNYAIELAEKNGCYKIMLLTGSKNEETHRFYEKLGFHGDDKTAYVIKKEVPKPAH